MRVRGLARVMGFSRVHKGKALKPWPLLNVGPIRTGIYIDSPTRQSLVGLDD